MINLSDIVMSTEFQEDITITTNTETVNAYGETTIANTTSTIKAVVLNNSTDLTNNPDYQAGTDAIEIYTVSTISPISIGKKGDNVMYHNDTYRIVSYSDYSSFGFNKAVAQLVTGINN